MHARTYKLFLGCALLLPLVAALAPAQDAPNDGPPKVLVVHREYLKPGKGGMLHERSESAFVHAFADAKSTYPYFALDSLSGPSRTLFLFSYDSFADWQKQTAAIRSNKALLAKVDQASLTDGDLLASYDGMALTLRPDLSLNHGNLTGARYFEITTFVVKPGHTHEFTELAKMYAEAYRKVAPANHWDCFEVMYGNPAPTSTGGSIFAVMNLMKSLAETDQGMLDSDKLHTAMGDEGTKKASELMAASVESVTTNLFAINPHISNPSSEWIKNDPGFWKPQ